VAASIFHIAHSDSLGKYLGCPVFHKRPNSVTFCELIDKTMSKLVGWKTKCLSKAGKSNLTLNHYQLILCNAFSYLLWSLPTLIELVENFFGKK